MLDDDAKIYLTFWTERLGIKKKITLKRVPRSKWDGGNGRHLWGSTPDGEILYSKCPSEETIVHELVHIKWPSLDEKTVRELTKAFVY